MFKECDLIGRYGSGIDRIKHIYKANGLNEPRFEEVEKIFRLTPFKETDRRKFGKGINSLYEYI